MRAGFLGMWSCLAMASLGCATSRSAWDGVELGDRIAAAESRNLRSLGASVRSGATAGREGSALGGGAFSLASSEDWAFGEWTLGEWGTGSGARPQEEGSGAGVSPSEGGVDRGPLPGFWETVRRDIKRMPRSMWEDTKDVYTDPGNLIILGSAGIASLAVRVTGVDGKFDDSHGRHDTFRDEWSDAIGALGNPGTHFAMAGLWYLVGQQSQDDKTYEVGRTLFNALTITGLSTMVLKVAANTKSPNGEGPGWPSGHTSSSFTVAEVLNVSYGPWVGVPSYALATLAAFGRIDDREHDFSDVIFGAVLGIVIGHTVADGHHPEIFGGEITAYVSPESGASGIAWSKSF